MKILYSSSFVSIVLAFLMFLGPNQDSIKMADKASSISFSNISAIELKELFSDRPQIKVYDSFGCKICADFATNTLPGIKQTFAETGKAGLSIIMLPKKENKGSYLAVLSAKCAADQGSFWQMHTALHQEDVYNNKSVTKLAKSLKLNTKSFSQCIKKDTHKLQIEKEVAEAKKIGINRTPTTVIGRYKLIGNQPVENIAKILNEQLTTNN